MFYYIYYGIIANTIGTTMAIIRMIMITADKILFVFLTSKIDHIILFPVFGHADNLYLSLIS